MTLKKVLLINGEPTVRELVQMCLSYLGGWQVSSVSSPAEGLQRAEQEQPDAIILDLSYSSMEYVTFLQHLRAQPTTQMMPVIVLTADAKWFKLKNLQQFKVLGVIDYLSDPIEIPKQIAKLLDWNENCRVIQDGDLDET
jgi:CheY-like chemotaxis protein